MIKQISVEKVDHAETCKISHFSQIPDDDSKQPFNLIHLVVNPLCNTERDQHRVKECWFILQGKGLLTTDDIHTTQVEKGQLFFFESMMAHQLYNSSSDSDLEVLSIWW